MRSSLFARLSMCAMALSTVGCATGGALHSSIRSAEVVTSQGRLDANWGGQKLREAALLLHEVLTEAGHEGFLRLRLHSADTEALMFPETWSRLRNVNVGLQPTSGDPRWRHFASFAQSPLVGFCARGVRAVEPGGAEGFRRATLVVDRLLLVGSEREGFWGVWIEGLVLTNEGWRLQSTVPFAQQVEDPRRNHADVQLWDCDLGHRPLQNRPLRDAP
ncbi:MAG: hypothetical protein Q8Q09_29710 [Deltaproteobacteria bacterium]|nr:hypothetical protein [Deltaproteobacteria bacterium]